MIRYQLQCDFNHVFEAWFSNSEAYENQSNNNLVVCPQCGSKVISKAIMAPNIGVKANRKHQETTGRHNNYPKTVAPQYGSEEAKVSREIVNTRHDILAAKRKIYEIIEQNAEYVGSEFAEEARKIHYEEVEERGIYGEASAIEVRQLLDEGIEIQPLPTLPKEHN
ncbi:MAG: hypothetical protein TECD_01171 [Hyphomicrobiaceae bacterium hypho_1]